jgi:hypothetical protein
MFLPFFWPIELRHAGRAVYRLKAEWVRRHVSIGLVWWRRSLDHLLLTYHKTNKTSAREKSMCDRQEESSFRCIWSVWRASVYGNGIATCYYIAGPGSYRRERIAKQHRDMLEYVFLYLHELYVPQKHIGYHPMSSHESPATTATTESIPLTP